MNKAQSVINKLTKSRWFPSDARTKVGLGLWWIVEPFLIEIPIANAFLSRYYWEILGPINLGLFFSTFFAVVYGTLCLGAGYVQLTITGSPEHPPLRGRKLLLAQFLIIVLLLVLLYISFILTQGLQQ